ncbi:hypothetical protein [Amycolatopsis sp. FDAARGOS 1241]|uniref:hypothetical protein n=1 Tax=Amycolatopsis sp. FDAARGOS 1241 TaxID=2778070 RepID=UPI00194DCCD6|nr:hypothetical protein [Amycolatopsis sp. FDAARGOS 1241]QRP50119.1 hypothetical protein I6J71_21870 [Amycolatopsis sp. FDAARGOS 1241]
MEPLTAIAVIATKYGVSAVIGALTGKEELGGVASEIVGALVESEDRLGEQLSGIERQLDEVLEQRYTAAVGAGLRTLLDASTTRDAGVRTAELNRARDLFRDAVASARSPLQVAVGERYLALCALALGRVEAVRTALTLLDKAALEALVGAMPLVGPQAYERAREQVGGSGFRSRREQRIEELGSDLVDAAAEVMDLALSLFDESRTLAEGLGHAGAEPDWDVVLPQEYEDDERLTRPAQVVLKPAGPGPLEFGPLSVTWDSVRFRPAAPQAARSAVELAVAAQTGARVPAGTLDVAVTVRLASALSVPLHCALFEPDAPGLLQPVRWFPPSGGTLEAGRRELPLRYSLPTGRASSECTLSVNGVLLFRSR